ncbi:hypothetical protein PA7_07540 [Pseudonocardia asaccharolytica DSM 44247 = NBRC 16224]|uniref:ABC-2 type transporter transmembrane domain-containing protein n=1 Tax=Pseudonocardia asaccharolytica DSM 44247 = NBRC 16224 TaxID=1123024 RepID=A0A511CWR5_9PSEU|nr:hypothetical protein PA7_07540 [Pseudonocardia asaccharolytica DSM 44247 = NBRC 16224]
MVGNCPDHGDLTALVAVPALVLLFAVAGLVMHVDLTAPAWLGVLPFAALGLLVGMVVTQDSAQPVAAVTMLVFSLLGGIFIPAQLMPAGLATLAHLLPSHWLAEIARGQACGEPLPGPAPLLAPARAHCGSITFPQPPARAHCGSIMRWEVPARPGPAAHSLP